MKFNFKNLINYLIVFVIFSNAFSFTGIFSFADFRISYLLMILVLLLWLPFLKGIYFNKVFIVLFSIIIIFSLYNVYIGKDVLGLLAKQVIGILFNAFVFYLLFKVNNYDVKKLFRIYLNIAVIIGVIGLVQELSYLLKFKAGYDFSYIIPWSTGGTQGVFLRVNSILSEPASFCYAMMPAFFVSLTSFLKNNFRFLPRWKSLVVILSFFLTFSTVGYVGIFFSLFLLIYNYRKIRYILGGIALAFVLVFFLWNYISCFNTRIGDSIDVLQGETSLETTNLSTFSLFSNALVSYNSFKDSPLFGSGLGSHEISYHRYIGEVVDINKISMFLNWNDANSLFLRLLSETGLFGLITFFYFIFKFHLSKKRDKTNYLWIINNAALAVLFIRLIRCGHYFIYGFFFFFWLYYFTWRNGRLGKNKKYYENRYC